MTSDDPQPTVAAARTAAAVAEAIEADRPEGSERWEFPVWESHLHAGIYPFCANVRGYLEPIGTAFAVSRLGIVLSALHNVKSALTHSWDGEAMLRAESLPRHGTLKELGLSVLHSYSNAPGKLRLTAWPLEHVSGAPPTDLVFGSPQFQTEIPYLSFPISLAVPRIGSTVTCIGYGDMKFPDEDPAIADPKARMLQRVARAAPVLKAVRARVTRIFVGAFARGFLEGPTFSIDADVEHGQSGGPVFDDRGYVVGVVTAGASHFFGEPAALISPLYPVLLTEVQLKAQIGPVSITGNQPILNLIGSHSIATDGTETRVHLTPEGDTYRLGPMIYREDGDHVFDDFAGYQKGVKGARVTEPGFRVRRTPPAEDAG